MKTRKYFVAMLLCSIAILCVHANNRKSYSSIDTVLLKEIVVTATRNPTTKWLAPTIVNILSNKIFENVGASCLLQGLSFVPGVRVENNCQNCGWTQVRMDGLDGHYSQILIDSRPLFSALINIYGLEQIPAGMIDHVEVMRGGGSALFGSSAIGGTINIITKEPRGNSGSIQHSLTTIGMKNTFENNTTIQTSVLSKNKKVGIYVFANNRYRQPYDEDGDGFSELNKIKTKSIGTHVILKPDDFNKLSIDYHSTHDYRRGGNNINMPPHDADLAETTEHEMNGGGFSYEHLFPHQTNSMNAYFSFLHTDRNSYYGADKSTMNYGLTHDFTYVAGSQFTHNFKTLLFLPATFIAGVEYNTDKVNDESVGYKVFTSQQSHTASTFAQNEWKSERYSLLVGGRIDKHNMIHHIIFSPRLNFRYSPNEHWNLRATMSGGFRAPQIYDEDLHVDLVNGNRRVIRLAKDLKEEKSMSWSGSADFRQHFNNIITDFMVELFYTDLTNAFAFRNLSEKTEDGATISERYNASGSRVYGLNCEAQTSFGSLMDLHAGLTWQRSEYKTEQQWSEDTTVPPVKKMFRTPDIYGYLSANITPVARFETSLTCNYTGSMWVQHCAGSGVKKDAVVHTPDFFEVNLKLSYDIPLFEKFATLQMNAGILNLFNSYQKDFDKGKERDSNYIYGPLIPRSVYTGIRLSF